jgi:hypothetical protein
LEVRRRVGERDPHVLRLGAVDLVAEDPSSATEALSVAALPAEAARAARRDARYEHPVTGLPILDPAPHRLDRADGFVTENAARRHRRDVTLQDVQIRPADGHGIDTHDRVGVLDEQGIRHLLPRFVAGPVINDGAHVKTSCPDSY